MHLGGNRRYFWFWLIVNIIIVFPHLPAKKYQEKLSSIYDLNLFRLNVPSRYPSIVSIVATIPHIVSTDLKVNFPVVPVI